MVTYMDNFWNTEWLFVKMNVPSEICSFLDTIFEIYEIRRKVGEANGIEFSVRTNEGNHTIPHIHAKYGDFNISIAIETGEVLVGNLPKKKEALAVRWVNEHRAQLISDWNQYAVSAISHTTMSRLNTPLSDD